MEIASIKGDTVLLLYHPAEVAADVGQQFKILELPGKTEGLVVQIISNDSLEYVGLQQEMIQRVLEERIAQVEIPLDHEYGMEQIKSLKLATAKIRKRVQSNKWCAWDGWIPTRNVAIELIEADDLLGNVLPTPRCPLPSFAMFNESPIEFDGPRLDMVNVVAGVKGSGKSHLAKHLVIGLEQKHVPCIIFDLNGEYVDLPSAQVLRWEDNFLPSLAEIGYDILEEMVRSIAPLQPGSPSASTFENRLPNIFQQRENYCRSQGQPFMIDIKYLRTQTWASDSYVGPAIDRRLELIDDLKLFWSSSSHQRASDIADIYEKACQGQPAVFDMRHLGPSLQRALVKSMNRLLEKICGTEAAKEKRYPFVFFEEAHFYISEDAILNLITRGRHIGIASVFITNSPEKLPDSVFRQLDNLFLLALTHKDDIRNVGKNSFTDQDTIESFATRMPEHHALIMGRVTDRYPLVLTVNALPKGVPPTGKTRSTWDRFTESSSLANEPTNN